MVSVKKNGVWKKFIALPNLIKLNNGTRINLHNTVIALLTAEERSKGLDLQIPAKIPQKFKFSEVSNIFVLRFKTLNRMRQ